MTYVTVPNIKLPFDHNQHVTESNWMLFILC